MKMTYKEVIEQMVEYAFKLDKLGYLARDNGIDYKAREYFKCAIQLREVADYLDYVLS